MEKVTEGLYRGPHPRDINALKAAGVTMVIDLQTAWDEISFDEDQCLERCGIKIRHRPLSDFCFASWVLLEYLVNSIWQEIQEGETVYVHCTHGVDRTGLIVCLIRIMKMGWKVEDAISEYLIMGMHRFPYLWPLNWPGKVRRRFS